MYGYLFYSKECKFCFKLITVMENQGLLGMFNVKCIDDMTPNDFAKLGLQCVPTLVVVNNQNGVEHKGIYENDKAFKWVDSVISNRRQNMIKTAENSRKLIEISDYKKRIVDGLSENCQSEMEGLSDAYAYWKDDMTQDIDIPQPKMFVPALNIGNPLYGIETIPDESGKKNKLKENDQKDLIKKLANLRSEEDTQLKNIMQQQQLNKVLGSV